MHVRTCHPRKRFSLVRVADRIWVEQQRWLPEQHRCRHQANVPQARQPLWQPQCTCCIRRRADHHRGRGRTPTDTGTRHGEHGDCSSSLARALNVGRYWARPRRSPRLSWSSWPSSAATARGPPTLPSNSRPTSATAASCARPPTPAARRPSPSWSFSRATPSRRTKSWPRSLPAPLPARRRSSRRSRDICQREGWNWQKQAIGLACCGGVALACARSGSTIRT